MNQPCQRRLAPGLAPLQQAWQQSVGNDARFSLKILESPYASLVAPFADFVDASERSDPEQTFTMVHHHLPV